MAITVLFMDQYAESYQRMLVDSEGLNLMASLTLLSQSDPMQLHHKTDSL